MANVAFDERGRTEMNQNELAWMTWRAVLLTFSGRIDSKTFDTGYRILWTIGLFGAAVLAPFLQVLAIGLFGAAVFAPISDWGWYTVSAIILIPGPLAALITKRVNDAGRSVRLIAPALLLFAVAMGLSLAVNHSAELGKTHCI